jgi:hypothetical protein
MEERAIMNTIKPGGRHRSGRTPAGRRLAAWTAASVLAGAGLASASLLAGAPPALADTGTDCPAAVVSGATATVTCGYTGGSQYWTVPAGVTQATFTLYGAAGGQATGDESGGGGFGAEVSGALPVTAGTVLQVNVGQVGQQGGTAFGGGGAGGSESVGLGGGGGGESDVRAPDANGDYPRSAALLVAGGGGGGGDWGLSFPPPENTPAQPWGGNGGDADTAGAAPAANVDFCGDTFGAAAGGAHGTTTAGGAGGAGGSPTAVAGSSCTAVNGAAGAAGTAGTGGTGGNGNNYGAGGGGGGGYYGGGGGGGGAVDQTWHETGAGAGGGGGASYLGSTGTLVTDEGNASNGEVVITYQVAQPPAFTADSPPTVGGAGTAYSYQFAASGTPAPTFSLSSGAPSWLAVDSSTGAVTGTPPAGTTSFSYSVTASNQAGSVTAGPFRVTVSAKADLTAALSCPAGLTVGASGTCTLTVTNNGPALATKVAAGAVVPANLTVTGCSDGCSQLGGALGWSLGSLPAGQSDALTIRITATHAGTALVTAADGAATPDPNLLNNLAAATVKITR